MYRGMYIGCIAVYIGVYRIWAVYRLYTGYTGPVPVYTGYTGPVPVYGLYIGEIGLFPLCTGLGLCIGKYRPCSPYMLYGLQGLG